MATKNLLQAIHDALVEEMRADDTVMIMGEDVGKAGGVFRVTEGLAEEFGSMRAMDTPLAESLIVGAAIGLSVNGIRPVAEIQFADFIPPAFDQIVNGEHVPGIGGGLSQMATTTFNAGFFADLGSPGGARKVGRIGHEAPLAFRLRVDQAEQSIE